VTLDTVTGNARIHTSILRFAALSPSERFLKR
jgi:hypothetical protein